MAGILRISNFLLDKHPWKNSYYIGRVITLRYKKLHNVLVGRDGSFRSLKTKRRLRPAANNLGYLQVSVNRDGNNVTCAAHVLVAEAWIGPRPPGEHVRHLNGDKTDNRVENLAYGSPKDNARDSEVAGKFLGRRFKRCPVRRGDGKTYSSCWEAAKEFNNQTSAHINIHRCARNQQKTYKGYSWEFIV